MGEPAGLLDDYLRIARYHVQRAVPPTAIRLRSLEMRRLLAYIALRETGATYADLLAAVRSGDVAWLRRIKRDARSSVLAGLAQTLALQDMLPADRTDALGLYALVRDAWGAPAMPGAHQGLHAQLTYTWRGADAARALLRTYSGMSEAIRTDLEIDVANPFAGDGELPVAPWLAAFQRLMPKPYPALDPANGLPPFDRLTAGAEPLPVDEPHRISVIVTAFHPDEGLITAVRSILAQSWRNVEIVVVDDASPPEYDEILQRAAALGPRIRVVKQPYNQGTYAARNAGLDAAEGEFAAFQDSDDWSHPRRLELQVRPMLENARIVATTTDGLAVTERLVLTRPAVRRGRFNPSSLLFRRQLVMDRIGYFDQVRKAADSEYIGRMRAVYGERAVRHIDSEPLALIRLSQGSLSRSEIRAYWMHPARVAYSSAYQQWHGRIAARAAKPYLPREGGDRPFAAPDHLRYGRGEAPPRPEYDVVMAGDWRFLQGPQLSAVEEMLALADRGLRVAVLHLESLRPPARRRYPLAGPIQKLVNAGRIAQVLPGDVNEAALVVVRHAAALQFAPDDECLLRPRRVLIVADQAPVRRDGLDHRYEPAACTATATRLFDAPVVWCPQDPEVRTALRGYPALELTPYDLPVVIGAERWTAARDGATRDAPVAGTDLCDQGVWPRDTRESLYVFDGLRRVDVRLRLPDWPRIDVQLGGPRSHLVYEAGDLDLRTFLHQLDFYLHFPHPETVETFSRPACEAAAQGCVVVTQERHAAVFGDAAVYCAPAEVAGVVKRYTEDRVLFAEQSRRARAVVANAHPPQAYVDRIAALVHAPRHSTPAQRTPEPACA
ncbi:glycosyltransferase family A protein [Couchioplanes caeruleus]|uniref:Glycosyl transferase family 2 n=1 Tax=Couchioplanes caeruleus subsp. caeruleus TaxID=56427 RepID=A0A1K0FLL4_9ACTN|nr:glycosyltransferase family A protein [Couchioplanes caeruleus]OJF13697.1 glycosyl transferase family 2 [Couchioplanes caeruleus subsp. caeruleus]